MELKIKRLTALIISVIIMHQCFALSCSALKSVSVEQVLPLIPDMTAIVRLETEKDETVTNDDCFAKFGKDGMTVKSIEKYDKIKHTSTVYFLVDTSESISSAYLKEVKKKLVSYSNKLSGNQKMVLISFGTKVSTLLKGGESKDARKSKINSLKTGESQTNLFNAIKSAVEMSQSETTAAADRSYAVVISDGENFDEGGGSTQKEVTETVSSHGLPIYALCMGGTRNNASEFGSLARQSGGEIYTAANSGKISPAFDKLIKKADNVFILSMRTQSPVASDGEKKALQIRVKDRSTAVDIKPTRWIKDDAAPEIIKIESADSNGTQTVCVYYSENVINADVPENFKLKRADGEKEIIFTKAKYVFNDNEYYTVLTPEKEIAKHDDYILTAEGIKDSSNEQNALVVSDEEYELGEQGEFMLFLSHFWWILLIAAAVIAAAVLTAVMLMRKSKQKEENGSSEEKQFRNSAAGELNNYDYLQQPIAEKHHIIVPQGRDIVFKIKDGRSDVKTVKTKIQDKLVIGRSDSCDIYIDDLKMSRTHFQIEYNKGEFWITDLNSANGTVLNNVKVSRRRIIKSNDVILAGQATITVIF